MKTRKIVVLTILVVIVTLAVPVSAALSFQSIETRADRIVAVAQTAQERVTDLVTLVTADTEAMTLIIDAGLEDDFYGNVSLCVQEGTTFDPWTAEEDGEGWIMLEDAKSALAAEEYEAAIDCAREALTIFRDAIHSMHVVLFQADVEVGPLLEPGILQEAIDRSQNRIDRLRALLDDEEMLAVLDQAEDLLSEAHANLDPENIDDAKDILREANQLISQVCRNLRQIAEGLNPQRIRDYCEVALRFRQRFRERFGEAESEGFDVDGFLQGFGYQSEDDFMARFRELIQTAEGAESLDDVLDTLEEIGSLIRNMNQNFIQEMHHYREQFGRSGTAFGQEGADRSSGQDMNSYGQNTGAYGESSSSSQMAFRGTQ